MIALGLIVVAVTKASALYGGGMGMMPGMMPWMKFGFPGMMPWWNFGHSGKKSWKSGYNWMDPYKFARSAAYNPYYANDVMKPFHGIADYRQVAQQLAMGHGDDETPYKNVPGARPSKKSKRSTGYYGGGGGLFTKMLPVKRPWNNLGMNYAGMAWNPYYSYSKSAYFNYLNKKMRSIKFHHGDDDEEEEGGHGRKKRSLYGHGHGGNHYYTGLLPIQRPWMNMGYSHPGFAFNPFFSYSKSGYFNWLNKQMPFHRYGGRSFGGHY